jgi:hypothetical protein
MRQFVMASDQEQTSRKLVYLRDHSPRLRPRTSRSDRKPQQPPHADLAGESVWLGRSLFVVAGGAAVYWLLIATSGIRPEGDEAWRWTMSHSLSHAFVAGTSALAARVLLRGGQRATLFIALAAGGMIVTALEGLTHLLISGDLSQISLSARTDILARAALLAIGIWASSYALRTERRVPTG